MRAYCVIVLSFFISHFLFWLGIYWYHVPFVTNQDNAIKLKTYDKGGPEFNVAPETSTSIIITTECPTTLVETTSTTSATSTTTTSTISTTKSTLPPTTENLPLTTLKQLKLSAATKEIESYLEYIKSQDHERYWLNTYSSTNAELFYSYVPQISCSTKVRVGGLKDGGKWMCNPWHLRPRNCTVYSLGVGLNTIFDQDIADRFRCKIFAVDPDEFTGRKLLAKNIPNVEYFSYYIDGGVGLHRTRKHKTLRQLMMNFHHTNLDVLKIDVEGAEFDIFDSFYGDFYNDPEFAPRICQILIEVHTWDIMKWMRLFKTLEKFGFLLFSREINLLGFGSKFDKLAAEYSYIHKDCLHEYGIGDEVYFKNFPSENFFTTAMPPIPL